MAPGAGGGVGAGFCGYSSAPAALPLATRAGAGPGAGPAATWGSVAATAIGWQAQPTRPSARADWPAQAGRVSSEWEGAEAPPLGTLLHYNFFFLLLSPPDLRSGGGDCC